MGTSVSKLPYNKVDMGTSDVCSQEAFEDSQ